MSFKNKGLGRGLDVLLGAENHFEGAQQEQQDRTQLMSLDQIKAGKYQPRFRMDESSLIELSNSIKEHGIMQPILVRPFGVGQFEIIAGERRFRAAKLAGLKTVPVLIKSVPDESALVLALIENIQREDLNAIEEAQGMSRLIEEFGLTHDQVSKAVGKSRSTISNLLRLLNLVESVQTMLIAGDIEMGHARALLALTSPQQLAMAQEIVNKRYSVREVEREVAKILAGVATKTIARQFEDYEVVRLQEKIADWIAYPVALKTNQQGKGQLQIQFNTLDELDGILERIGFQKEGL